MRTKEQAIVKVTTTEKLMRGVLVIESRLEHPIIGVLENLSLEGVSVAPYADAAYVNTEARLFEGEATAKEAVDAAATRYESAWLTHVERVNGLLERIAATQAALEHIQARMGYEPKQGVAKYELRGGWFYLVEGSEAGA